MYRSAYSPTVICCRAASAAAASACFLASSGWTHVPSVIATRCLDSQMSASSTVSKVCGAVNRSPLWGVASAVVTAALPVDDSPRTTLPLLLALGGQLSTLPVDRVPQSRYSAFQNHRNLARSLGY